MAVLRRRKASETIVSSGNQKKVTLKTALASSDATVAGRVTTLEGTVAGHVTRLGQLTPTTKAAYSAVAADLAAVLVALGFMEAST